MRFSESINDAISLLETIKSPSHGVMHARGVVDLAMNICAFFDVDAELIEVACWWHDTGRIEGVKNHELLSASMAFENLSLHGFSRSECKRVFDMIRFHGMPSLPKTTEGKILSDADKLDLLSVERWQQCLEFKNAGLLNDLSDKRYIINIVPSMRDSVLMLEKSRAIFDQMIPRFLDFLSSCPDQEVRQYYNELIPKVVL